MVMIKVQFLTRGEKIQVLERSEVMTEGVAREKKKKKLPVSLVVTCLLLYL